MIGRRRTVTFELFLRVGVFRFCCLVKTIVGGSVGFAQIFHYHSFPCFVWALNTACVLFQSTSNLKVAFDWGHIQIQIFENISWNQRTHIEWLKVLYVSGIVVCAQLNGFRIFLKHSKYIVCTISSESAMFARTRRFLCSPVLGGRSSKKRCWKLLASQPVGSSVSAKSFVKPTESGHRPNESESLCPILLDREATFHIANISHYWNSWKLSTSIY